MEIIIRIMNLFRILIGSTKAYIQKYKYKNFSVRFSTIDQNPNHIHNANNNRNLRNYSILSFFLDKKRNKKVKALNFYFVRKS